MASQFSMAILERETSAQIGGGGGGANMRASCVAVISAARFDRFSSYRNYRWGDSSSIFGPNMVSEAISECLILKIFLGEQAPRPPDPPSLFALRRTQWPYQSKIADSGPAVTGSLINLFEQMVHHPMSCEVGPKWYS